MLLTAIYLITSLSANYRQIQFQAGPGPLDNPMKGFASYCDPGQVLTGPSQMAFEEIGWDKVEPAEGQYTFSDWESKYWDVAPAKGKHTVIRIYLDYPHKASSVPKWLVAKGVKMTPYDEFGGGLSPDYENPELRKSVQKLIAAMGARYDHDPRVDYVQVGLLGHWGEWHCYPHDKLFASPEVQSEILSAMHAAFPDKPVMARNASYASCHLPWIGFHDDMIPEDTLGKDDWDFLPAILKAGCGPNWQVAPTGGEMVPGAAKQYLGRDWDLLVKSVKEAHFTWIGPYCPAMASGLDSVAQGRSEELIRMLGYEYRLEKLTAPKSVPTGQTAEFSLTANNQGVAPFYGAWKPQVVLLDGQNQIAQTIKLTDDVRKWLPGEFSVSWKSPVSVPAGSYRIGFGVVDPSNGRSEVKFANALPVVNGYTVLGILNVTG